MVRPVFKTAMDAAQRGPVGSIPTRSRQPAPAGWSPSIQGAPSRSPRTVHLAALLLSLAAAPLAAQGPRTESDSIPALPKPVLTPGGAFLRSAILPGWGQLAQGERVTAVLFGLFEAVTVSQTVRAYSQVSSARDSLARLPRPSQVSAAARSQALTDSVAQDSVVRSATRSREDWLVLLVFNHLLSGLESFIAAHLGDFPSDLRIRVTPRGVGAYGQIPFRLR